MAGEYLLDTNIAIAYLNGREESLIQHVHSSHAHLPFMVVAELLYGARKSNRPQHNLQTVRELASRLHVIYPDDDTVEHFAIIRHRLAMKGRPIPEADIWIAAIAMQNSLILISRDAHFGEVEDLLLESW